MKPRKKSKPNPEAQADARLGTEVPTDASTATPTPSAQTLPNTPSSKPVAESTNTSCSTPATPPPSGDKTANKKTSRKWLGGGSWRSKASPTVKTAKDSIGISVSGGAASPLPTENETAKDQSPAKFLTKRKSSKSVAIPASMTKLNVSSDGSIDQTEEQKPKENTSDETTPRVDEPPLPPYPSRQNEANDVGTWGWRSWWSRPDGYSEPAKVNNTEDASRTPLPGSTPSEEPDAASKELGNGMLAPPQGKDTDMKDAPAHASADKDTEMKDALQADQEPPKSAPATSWFWLWSSTQNAQPNPTPEVPLPTEEPAPKADEALNDVEQDVQSTQQQNAAPEPPQEPVNGNASAKEQAKEQPQSSAWAFWFKDKPKGDVKGTTDQSQNSQKHVGEVAVSDTPSQSNPEPAQFNEQESKQAAKEPAPSDEQPPKSYFPSLRGRSRAKSLKNPMSNTPSSSKAVTPSVSSSAPSPTRPDTAPAAQTAPTASTAQPAPAAQTTPKQATKAKDEPPNLILPEFHNTYSMAQQPSFWQQVRQYFLGGETAMPHLHINPAPHRVRKAVAIGVHGFFPAPILQKVMGQPKGTSIRFSNAAAAAIKEWCDSRGYEPDIEQIALEGEGFIADRVKTLWKLLLNWIDHIKQADFILVACHSQGVPVAIMLVAKLIQFGCVNESKIGVCAMAGVNMGPFPEYKTKYLGPTAAELFEFGNPKSLVSQMYLAALDEVLRFGVRILYVGSIDDQLVSLESSTFATLSHPYIYRAVFVDGRIHAPDFITHLVGFTLKLRNLGLPDHGLIRELSPALAGSLYGGEGHSRVYEDPHVYTLAVQHALETTSLPVSPAQTRPNAAASFAGINIPVPGAKVDPKDMYKLRVKDYSDGSAGVNPYYLPWAMRGLLEEEFVKKALGREVEELLSMFELWKPTAKQLKDVKFRLEAVRSKL